MPDENRIREILENCDSNFTPEQACSDDPDLLAEVRARWDRIQRVRRQLDDLLPSMTNSDFSTSSTETELPQIEGYEVVSVLGRGGMGVVFKARHLKLNRFVALKMLLSGMFAGSLELARFRREALAVAALQHPNIVQIHDVGDLSGQHHFTMEFVEGGTLAQKLAGAPQVEKAAAQTIATLACAVQFAHQSGLIHRDLKPANILLTAEGVPKISDFGLARSIETGPEFTLTGARIGTPSYMAPEQAMGLAHSIGPAVDIYGLGAILYEMLTGRPPFKGESALETEKQVIADDPIQPCHLNPKVSRDLETICLKCLQKNPSRRYASAQDLADDLHRFLDRKPVIARPVGNLERAFKWTLRHPTVAAVCVFLMAAIGSGIWLFQHERARFAERRAETQRLEERQSKAVESVLDQAAALQKQGRWPDAKAVLEGAPSLEDIPGLAKLRQRMDQAVADVRMVTRLEDIPIRQVEVRAPSSHRQYVDAFRQYGIELPTPEAAQAAVRIRASAIHEPLLAFLHDWAFHFGSPADRQQLAAILDLADDDDWRRRLRKSLLADDRAERHILLQASEAPDQPTLILGLIYSISIVNQGTDAEEAMALLRAAQLRHPEDYWINLQLGGISMVEHPEQAVGYFRAAVASRPESSQAYIMLGRALYDSGDTDGAIAAFRKAIPLTSNRCAPRDLARALASRGGLEEARVHWAKMLEPSPLNYDPWDGYALLCAFLGNDHAYRIGRRALLDRTRDSAEHWTAAERDGQACLILPASGDELQRAVSLVELAAANGPTFFSGNSWIQFVEGLAAYRQGRFDQAVPLLEDSAALLANRAGPRVTLAMAQFQLGHLDQARKTLSAGVLASNWMESQADHPAAWVSHVLRREAETLILRNLPAFLRGEYEPQDNDERLALVGICQAQSRYTTAARLYAAAFQADPELADKLTIECRCRSMEDEPFYERVESINTDARYLAARCATLAGCGQGKDAAGLNQAERARWRQQAREWLQADLALWKKTLINRTEKDLALARRMLTHWQAEPDLAAIRDLKALDEVSASERDDCFRFWDEVGRVLRETVVQERAIALDPKLADPRRVPNELLREGRLEEARQAWQIVLDANPLDHNFWWGYAELCLFLDRDDEYRRARQNLLARFYLTSNPWFAERTARACLLLPATEDELHQAGALARHATATDPSAHPGDYPWFLFARGLSEYRNGKFEQAISTMRGVTSRLSAPAARIVLAMALHQNGQLVEAQKTLAMAILSEDWRSVKARDSAAWVSHLHRREAQELILPNLPLFRRGEYQPQGNDERLALLAGQIANCEFEDLHGALGRLYAEAFAIEPTVADDASSGARYRAARAAVLAGCGRGNDAEQFNDEDRSRLRQQALGWLGQELTSYGQRLDAGNAEIKTRIRQGLQSWRDDPDMVGVHDKDALASLSEEERDLWQQLWSNMETLLRRAIAAE